MALSWRSEKKLITFLIVFAAFSLIAFMAVYFIVPKPSCRDGRQNQGEEGIDCGGSCTPCVRGAQDMVRFWARVFKISDGVYDVASLVENPNISYAMPLFKYTFKVYDKRNNILATKEGKSFLNPRDRFIVFETGIRTGSLVPVRADMTVEYLSEWKYVEGSNLPLVVSEKKFSNKPSPLLEVNVRNQSLYELRDIQLAAILYDEEGNAAGASLTTFDSIPRESIKTAIFTWPEPFEKEPVSSEILIRRGNNL